MGDAKLLDIGQGVAVFLIDNKIVFQKISPMARQIWEYYQKLPSNDI